MDLCYSWYGQQCEVSIPRLARKAAKINQMICVLVVEAFLYFQIPGNMDDFNLYNDKSM